MGSETVYEKVCVEKGHPNPRGKKGNARNNDVVLIIGETDVRIRMRSSEMHFF